VQCVLLALHDTRRDDNPYLSTHVRGRFVTIVAIAAVILFLRARKSSVNVPHTLTLYTMALFAVIGNGLVILVFYRERRLRRRTNYYIVSLAIADLLVGLFGIPFAISASVGLPSNLYGCLFTVSLLVVLCTTSIFCLVAVSVDRYWAILHPMAYSRNVRTKTAIFLSHGTLKRSDHLKSQYLSLRYQPHKVLSTCQTKNIRKVVDSDFRAYFSSGTSLFLVK
ncbi:hypothetical protein L9F63_016754, partial [Diploptera punctata]